MNPHKYPFNCPHCGFEYLERLARGGCMVDIKGEREHITYHIFICISCWEKFTRIHHGCKLLKTVLDGNSEYFYPGYPIRFLEA